MKYIALPMMGFLITMTMMLPLRAEAYGYILCQSMQADVQAIFPGPTCPPGWIFIQHL